MNKNSKDLTRKSEVFCYEVYEKVCRFSGIIFSSFGLLLYVFEYRTQGHGVKINCAREKDGVVYPFGLCFTIIIVIVIIVVYTVANSNIKGVAAFVFKFSDGYVLFTPFFFCIKSPTVVHRKIFEPVFIRVKSHINRVAVIMYFSGVVTIFINTTSYSIKWI